MARGVVVLHLLITVLAEIVPQPYFTRAALRLGSSLAPVLRFYRILLHSIAWPTARAMNTWLGREEIRYLRESDLHYLIRSHMDATEIELDAVESQGGLNSLELEDVSNCGEARPLTRAPSGARVRWPPPLLLRTAAAVDDEFPPPVNPIGRSWVVIIDPAYQPAPCVQCRRIHPVGAFYTGPLRPDRHCHRSIIACELTGRLGEMILRLRVPSYQAG